MNPDLRVMKFLLVIFFIYLLGADAKHKSKRSRVERRLQRDGFRSSFGKGARSMEQPDMEKPNLPIDHGNVAPSPSKYGHLGLKEDTGENGDSPDGTNAEQGGQLNALNVARDVGSEVKPSEDLTFSTNAVNGGQLVQIKSQGSQPAPSNLIDSQPPNFGQSASFYGSVPSQLYGHPASLGNVQMQSSNYGSPGSNSFYQAAPAQGSQDGTPYGNSIGHYASSPIFAPGVNPFGQGGATLQQPQYLNPDQPQGFPGFGMGTGQGRFGQSNIQTSLSTAIGQHASYYGAVPGQGTSYGAVPGQGTNYGAVPGTNAQNGQLLGVPGQWGQNGQSGVQGPYSGIGQPTNYYGVPPGNNIQGQQGFVWSASLGTPGNFGQIAGQLAAPTSLREQPQLGQNPQLQQYVPGHYGGVEKAVITNSLDSGDTPIHDLSRFINTGFYYPPPQHLNANPNAWDPSARYFFSLNDQGNSLPATSNPFPISYSKI